MKEIVEEKNCTVIPFWLTSLSPPSLGVGPCDQGCQWKYSLLCVFLLYCCYLSHRQLCKLSTNPRFTFSFLSHTHTHSESITHHSQIHAQTAGKHKHSQSRLQIEAAPWRFGLSWIELSDPLLSTDVQSRQQRCTVCVCGLIFMALEKVLEDEERRGDGILVTCSCYWLHFVALCSSSSQRQAGEEKKIKEGTDSRRKGQECKGPLGSEEPNAFVTMLGKSTGATITKTTCTFYICVLCWQAVCGQWGCTRFE